MSLGPATFKLSRTAVDSRKTKRAQNSFPCRKCEHMETAQFLGDDTRAAEIACEAGIR